MKSILALALVVLAANSGAVTLQDIETKDCYLAKNGWFGQYRLSPVECPGTPVVDTDGDGIPDDSDPCPADPTNTCNEPPPPPADSDGDGIPDSEDECPNDPTNTCNDPPVGDGDYKGIPEIPSFASNPGPATAVSGTVSSLSNGHFTCNGGTLSAQSGDQIDLGSNTVVSDCVLNGDRWRGQGNNIAVLGGEVNFPSKVGISLSGSNLVVKGTKVEGAGAGGSTERHGINFGCGSTNGWVIENRLLGASGDGFQSGHNCGSNPLSTIYLGGNYAAYNRENAYDTKRVEGYVVSGNTAEFHASAPKNAQWCYQGRCGSYSSGSDGAAIVAGSDGATNDAVFYDNVLRNNGKGIRIEESPNAVIDGNTVSGSSVAVELEKQGGTIQIHDNDFGGGAVRSRFRSFNFCINASGNTSVTYDLANDTRSCSTIAD